MPVSSSILSEDQEHRPGSSILLESIFRKKLSRTPGNGNNQDDTGQEPNCYYYRDKDKKEIDLVFEQDNRLYPVEIKLVATLKREWLKTFAVLQKFDKAIGPGGVICMVPEHLPLSHTDQAIPVSFL